jgi:hypothetical protein
VLSEPGLDGAISENGSAPHPTVVRANTLTCVIVFVPVLTRSHVTAGSQPLEGVFGFVIHDSPGSFGRRAAL